MKMQSLTVGLKVKHPQYGVGTVKTIAERTAEIRFEDSVRLIDPELSELIPAEPSVTVSGLESPLKHFVANTIESVLDRLGYENQTWWSRNWERDGTREGLLCIRLIPLCKPKRSRSKCSSINSLASAISCESW